MVLDCVLNVDDYNNIPGCFLFGHEKVMHWAVVNEEMQKCQKVSEKNGTQCST